MSENSVAEIESSAHDEVVEELLRQLVDARFVLTDREGGVTRWSRPAEELFGWPGARMLGRRLQDSLELGDPLPAGGGVVQTTARRKDGETLEVALTLVPVSMNQSLEFNGFLEALEIAAPCGNAMQQMQASHRTVVDWIHTALRGEARIDEEDFAAGTIVAFRPLGEAPPLGDDQDDLAGGWTEPEPRDRGAELERAFELQTAELAATRAALDETRMQVDALAVELERVRGDAAQALESAERLAARVEQAELAREAAESAQASQPRTLFARREERPKRAPREGFDDVPKPLAEIELDGKFRHLNPAFSELVGYSESEFSVAVWPPVMDRANLEKHRQQMKAMLAGEYDSAEVKTGYVHAQGLLVPVVGRISLVREDGEPSHFLLEAEGR